MANRVEPFGKLDRGALILAADGFKLDVVLQSLAAALVYDSGRSSDVRIGGAGEVLLDEVDESALPLKNRKQLKCGGEVSLGLLLFDIADGSQGRLEPCGPGPVDLGREDAIEEHLPGENEREPKSSAEAERFHEVCLPHAGAGRRIATGQAALQGSRRLAEDLIGARAFRRPLYDAEAPAPRKDVPWPEAAGTPANEGRARTAGLPRPMTEGPAPPQPR